MSLLDCAEAGGISKLVVIMQEPQADVYTSDLGKHTKRNACDTVFQRGKTICNQKKTSQGRDYD